MQLEPKSLQTLFFKAFETFRHKTIFKQIHKGQVIKTSYGTFENIVNQWVNIFSHYDIKPGDRIGLLARSSPHWIQGFVAALFSKATVVCLDVGLDDPQLIRLIEQSELKLLLVATHDHVNFTRVAYASVTTLDLDNNLKPLLETGSHLRNLRDKDPSIACILFTSGTTGLFKGVILEHSAIIASTISNQKMIHVTPQDSVLCVLPAHHVYGLLCTVIMPIVLGATLCYPEKLEGPSLLQAFTLTKPTIIVGVPRVFQLFSSKIDSEISKKPSLLKKVIHFLLKGNWILRQKINLNMGKFFFHPIHKSFGGRVRLCVSGGAPLDSVIFQKLNGYGFTIMEGYGLTETCASVVANPVKKPKAGSVGLPVFGAELRLNPTSEALHEGEGEICIRGPMLMRGYFRDENSTRDAIKEGWYHTGDLGRRDSEGYVYITGRIKELIVLANGKKVMPSMVEDYFSEMPGVSDFALVGIARSDNNGEELHAAVVIDPQAIKAQGIASVQRQIEQEIRTRLSKLPEWWRFKKIHFLEAIPRTTTLKIKRKVLSKVLSDSL